ATGTNFFLTRWQYASQGYNTLSDVLDSYRHNGNRLWSWRENLQPSSRTTLMLSQSWGRHLGNLSLTGSRT
ncbi:hypothetical protein, partial [Salmonella sp. SAL04281]